MRRTEIFTSSYAIAGRHPDAVACSQGIPRWFRGRVYKALAPHRWMIKIGADGDPKEVARFRELYYEKILAPLDVRQVLADLGDNAILLCWEAPGSYCHRRLAAEWIESEVGIVVPEWPRANADVSSVSRSRRKAMKSRHERAS
jgi:hypothetical protein